MSDGPIQKGDLVMVVKPTTCCNNSRKIGFIYRVSGIRTTTPTCDYCKTKSSSVTCADEDAYGGFRLTRLKRIPPLAELESTEHKEELLA